MIKNLLALVFTINLKYKSQFNQDTRLFFEFVHIYRYILIIINYWLSYLPGNGNRQELKEFFKSQDIHVCEIKGVNRKDDLNLASIQIVIF